MVEPYVKGEKEVCGKGVGIEEARISVWTMLTEIF
jgi:hypothetical protein